MASSLRSLLEPGSREDRAFKAEGPDGTLGTADVPVDMESVHVKLAHMHRGLVAHDALNQKIVDGGGQPCHKLLGAIERALDMNKISQPEARWLRHFNREANKAKHDFFRAAPF